MRPPSPISFEAVRRAHHAVYVDRVLAGQRGGVGRGIVDRAADGDARIVDEDVEPAERLGDVVHELLDFG